MLHPAFGSKPSRVQRTSSVDTRKEITHHTWISLLTLLKPREYFVTVDNTSIWRKHMSWAKTDGKELRQLLTAKFGTNMVFMSLLLGAEMNVLFNSNKLCTEMRQDMQVMNFTPHFWAGIAIIISVICTLFTILTTFAAWSMVSCISDENSHCMLRSSIGQYCCFLPSRLIVTAIYSFLIWISLFIHIMMPHLWSVVVFVAIILLFFHVMTVFSAFGRLIMHSGAMGTAPIFDPSFEDELLPRGLHTSLLFKALDELRKGTSVTRQYKNPCRPVGRVDPIEENGSAHDTAVHFSDSVRSASGTPDAQDSIRGYHRVESDPSLTESIPSQVIDQWVSKSVSIDSVEQQASYDLDSPHSFSRRKAAPKSELHPRPVMMERKSASDSHVAQEATRPSFTKMRPSLLNAGGHTLKSIRRMAESMEEHDSDNNTRELSGRSKEGISPTNTSRGIGANTKMAAERRTTRAVDKRAAAVELSGGDIRSTEGTEAQQLLPKPSLRPPTYTSSAMLPPSNGKNSLHNRIESDPGPSAATMDRLGPGGLRRRTETAELIDIVSQCVSPVKVKERKDSLQAPDEIDRLI